MKIKQIETPVCTGFRPKHHNDQLCYFVDLNQIKAKPNPKDKLSFSLLISFNEDRELYNIFQEKRDLNNIIYIESIGN